MRTNRRKQRLLTVLARRQPDLTVVMENIHDPHNVSAVLRSADAVGIHEVQLVYTSQKFPRMGTKSSSSAQKWVGRRKFESVEACFRQLRKERFTIYATRIDDKATSLYDLDLTGKVAVVFGNEHEGVSEAAAALADRTIMIPMMGMIHSLNVSVACAVVLYETLRQRMLAGDYTKSKFSSREHDKLVREWLTK